MGRNVVIGSPAINSPFAEPQRHFQFDDEGNTVHIVEARRNNPYSILIAQPKTKGRQLVLDTEWTADPWNAQTEVLASAMVGFERKGG